eukprot:scaffold205149_cov15-Tisochrysis_lutea.AAC.1
MAYCRGGRIGGLHLFAFYLCAPCQEVVLGWTAAGTYDRLYLSVSTAKPTLSSMILCTILMWELQVGAVVGGVAARQRKDELERLNEQLRKINLSLRQQARAGTLYAPGRFQRYKSRSPSKRLTASLCPWLEAPYALPLHSRELKCGRDLSSQAGVPTWSLQSQTWVESVASSLCVTFCSVHSLQKTSFLEHGASSWCMPGH